MTRDARYSIRREYCDYDTPRWVARFCGDWLGQSKSRAGAQELVDDHKAEREAAMTGHAA